MAKGDVILVVEDDESLRLLVQMALADEGYDVVTAEDGRAARDRVREHPPRLILLDLRMPVMDGWEFGRVYRESSTAPAPIVVFTAGSDRALKQQDLPGEEFLAKPFDVDELFAVVKRYIDGEVAEAHTVS
jgi:two-component system KDP operon response regulator KdpE